MRLDKYEEKRIRARRDKPILEKRETQRIIDFANKNKIPFEFAKRLLFK